MRPEVRTTASSFPFAERVWRNARFRSRIATTSPRALDLPGKLPSKTVIRGGYGIFYDAVSQMPYGSRPAQNPPFYLQVDVPTANSASTSNIRVVNGFPADALDPDVLTGRSIAAVWPYSFPEGMTNQWNLNIQRSLPGNSIVSAAYVGANTAHRRLGAVQINQPTPGPGPLTPRRLFPDYADISMDVPIGTNNYQALELKFERRFREGFSLIAGHTYSHTMAGDISQNNTILAPEKALSPEDLRHRFFLSSVWDLPFGSGRAYLKSGLAGMLAGGWQLSPIFTAQTGLPFTPVVAGNPANTTGAIRPDRIADGNLPRDQRGPDRWFDASAFASACGISLRQLRQFHPRRSRSGQSGPDGIAIVPDLRAHAHRFSGRSFQSRQSSAFPCSRMQPSVSRRPG